MAVNVNNAFVAQPIDAGVYFNAPLGSTLPTDALAALDAEFADHGAVGEDGFAISQSRDSNDEKMMGGDTFVDVQQNYEETVKITLLEDGNVNVVKTVFGDSNVVATAGAVGTVYHTSEPLPIKSHVVQARSGDKIKRFVIEKGRVSEVSEVENNHQGTTKYEITIKTFKPSTPTGGKYANVIEYRAVEGAPVTP